MLLAKRISALLLVTILFVACNPSKRLNQAVIERKEQGVKVQYPAQAIETPSNINMVYDYENIYTPDQEKKLDSLLRNFEKSNLIPIKLVTVNSASLQKPDFDANNAELYKEWDLVHGKSGKTMVVTISTALEKAKADYGPFVSKFISEADIANVIQQAMPTMQRGEFFEGTRSGLIRMMDIIRNNVGK